MPETFKALVVNQNGENFSQEVKELLYKIPPFFDFVSFLNIEITLFPFTKTLSIFDLFINGEID